MEKLNVFYASSDAYAPFAGVSMTSLFMNNTDIESITVYVFPDDISEKNLARMRELADQYGRELVILDSSEKMKMFDSMELPTWRGSRVLYGRVFCSDFVPETVERLIALDSDTLIVGSLRPLLKLDMKGNCVAMVQACLPETKLLDPPVHYNIGLTVFNVKKWKDENWSKKTLDLIRTYPYKLIVADQEILNLTCRGSILKLPLQYDYYVIFRAFSDDTYYTDTPPEFYSREEAAYAREHPVVLHAYRFLGERAWDKDTLHPDKDIFDEYLLASPWSDYEKKPADKSVVFTVERLLYRLLPERVFYRIFNSIKKVMMKKQLAERSKSNPRMRQKSI